MAGMSYEKERAANVGSYAMFERLQWTSFVSDINSWRRKALRLPDVTAGPGIAIAVVRCKIPFSAMWSPSFVPKPDDWPEQCEVVGTFTQDQKKAGVVDEVKFADTIKWLNEGDPPVFIGFGSMVIKDTSRLEGVIMAAAKIANSRIIVQSSWSKMDVSGEPLCHNVGPCPHDWLLPLCSGVVHHGKSVIRLLLAHLF